QPLPEHEPARRAEEGTAEDGRLSSQTNNLSHDRLFAQLDGHNHVNVDAHHPASIIPGPFAQLRRRTSGRWENARTGHMLRAIRHHPIQEEELCGYLCTPEAGPRESDRTAEQAGRDQ
ncbi:MAG: hypothetical protein ACOY4L_10855, partial [Pseudomonadota bacterium]